MSHPTITLYTTPGCSACAAVRRYLQTKGLDYEEKDVSQNETWLHEMKQRSGVRIAPVTIIGEQAFYGDFAQQRPKLDAALQGA